MSRAPGSHNPRGPSSSGPGPRASEPRGEAFATYLNTYLMVCLETPVEADALMAFQQAFRLTAPPGFCAEVLAKVPLQTPCAVEACEEIEVELSAYLDGELDAEREDQVIVHLAGCKDCMRELSSLKALAVAMPRARLKPGPAPADFAARVVAEAFSAPVAEEQSAEVLAGSGAVAGSKSLAGPRFADEDAAGPARSVSRRGSGFFSASGLLSAAAGLLVAGLGALSFGPGLLSEPAADAPTLAHSARGGAAQKLITAPQPPIPSSTAALKAEGDIATASPPSREAGELAAKPIAFPTDTKSKAESTAGEGVQGEVLVVLSSTNLPKLRAELLGVLQAHEGYAPGRSPSRSPMLDAGVDKDSSKAEKGTLSPAPLDGNGEAPSLKALEAIEESGDGELVVELERGEAQRLLQALEARSSLREAWRAPEPGRDSASPPARDAMAGAGVTENKEHEKNYDPTADVERLAARKREESLGHGGATGGHGASPAEPGSPKTASDIELSKEPSKSSAVPATLILRDGWLLSGRVISEDSESLIFETAGERRRFLKKDVLELAIGQPPLSRGLETPGEVGEQSRQRLRLRIQVRAR